MGERNNVLLFFRMRERERETGLEPRDCRQHEREAHQIVSTFFSNNQNFLAEHAQYKGAEPLKGMRVRV